MIVPLAAAAGAAAGAVVARTLPRYDPSPFARAVVPGTEATSTPVSVTAALAGAGAVLFAGIALVVAEPVALLAWFVLAGAGLSLVMVDAYHHRLPNAVVFPAWLAGIVLICAHGVVAGDPAGPLRALAGSVALFVLYLVLAIVSPSGLGMGDVKLALVVGLYLGWLGWEPWIYGAAAGWVIGAAASAFVLVQSLVSRGRGPVPKLAFGPSMLAGVLAVLFVPALLV